MITQSFDLNLIPDSAPVVVHCDQYDHGTGRLVISLYEGDVAYSPSGTAIIQGIKPDNKGFNYSCTLSGNTVTADLTEQMSAVSGRVRCQIVVTESTGRTGTFVFILDVQSSALPTDSDMSESDYQLIEQAIEETQQAASDAEAWAVGERGGVPVPSGDPTYNNNSEYWAQIAQQYAQGGVHYKGSVIFANIPTTGMVSGDMYNIQNDFTTDSRFAEGAGINCPAGTNIVWNGSKWDLFAITKMGTLSDLSDVSINTPTDGQGLVYNASIQDWVNGDVSVPDMTTAVKGIGKPDGITTDVTSGTFRAKGVGIVADVNSGGTEYGSDWLYYTGTTTVIVPSTEQMYRVVVSGNASLYYWNGTSYTPLTSSSSSGVTSFNGRTGAVVPANGDYALNNMSDVSISTPSAGQVLGYDGSEWKNTAAPGGGGSIINVTTTESTLHGKTVTLTDGTTTLSSTFDNNGKAQFTGVTLTGNLTLSSSDGTNTATNTFIINFFGVYTKTLSFFTAYLTMTFPASVGATCTVGGETATTSPYTFTVNTSSPVYVVTLDGQTKAGGESLSDGQTKSVTVEYGTINLTFSNEFRGQTITCTKGGTTITKTAPSGSNSMAFYPPTTGSWTISGTYSGTTYVSSPNPVTVSSLSTPVSATLQTLAQITATIYSATEDTVTFTDAAGVSHTEVFASGQSSKSITFKILPAGSSITFTSSVAKDPSDLTADYSKTVTITDNTTDIYLMPDDAFYWYGWETSISHNDYISKSGSASLPTVSRLTTSISVTEKSNNGNNYGIYILNYNWSVPSGKTIKAYTGTAEGDVGTSTSYPQTSGYSLNGEKTSLLQNAVSSKTLTTAGYIGVAVTLSYSNTVIYALWYE